MTASTTAQRALAPIGLALLLSATTARAQTEGSVPTEAFDDPQSAPATPARPAPIPAAPPPPARVGSSCLIVNNGLDPYSATTAGQLVCDEIRNQGVVLASTGVVAGSAYRVSFDRLGNDLIVRVSYEAPVGSVIRTRRIVLGGPEELTVAAPRIARAIVHDEPLSDTERVDNLVKEETRKYEKKSGEFLWGFGILGVSGPGEGQWMAPGLEFMGYYETPDWGFGFSMRAAFEGDGEDAFSTSSISIGGRYFFSATDVSPFIGAGIGIGTITVKDSEDNFAGKGSGLGGFGEVGVEFMRLHSSRMILGLRLDAPFYQVKHEYWYDYSSGGSSATGQSRYEMPVTLSATYAW